jgi:predicted metalloprotease
MRLDELPRSDNIEDRRGTRLGVPMSRTGGLGIGTIIILGLIGWAFGINPLYLIGGAEILSGSGGSQQQPQSTQSKTRAGAPSDSMGEFVSAVLGSTEAQWKEIFAQAGKVYQTPTLVMFAGATCTAARF